MSTLLEEAAGKSVAATPKQIARWRSDDVLPPTKPLSRGRGRGVAREPDDATLEQLVALVSILRRNRSLDYAAFRLWVRGYGIPLERVRRALQKLSIGPVEKTRDKSEDDLAGLALAAEEKLSSLRTAPKQARKMARAGRLAPMLSTMFQLLGESPELTQEQSAAFARDFADYTSMEKAKTGIPELGIPGWLNDDPSGDLQDSLRIIPSFFTTVKTLTDEELIATRDLFRKYERMAILVEFIQKAAKDEAALGMGLLTRGPLGSGIEEIGPLMFTAIAVLRRAKPDLAEKINEMTAPVEATLQKIREAGITVPEY